MYEGTVEGLMLKEWGQLLAAENRADVLAIAQSVAYKLGQRQRHVCIDDVCDKLKELGIERKELGNAAGSVFKGGRWETVGFVLSRQPKRHAGVIRLWSLSEAWDR
jgi:hypothetical protein